MATADSVGVLFGGPSPEHDISILTGLQVARALLGDGLEVHCLYWTKSGAWGRVPALSEASDFLEPEMKAAVPVSFGVPEGFTVRRRGRRLPLGIRSVLNCCHGGPGEDGSLAALLRLAGLRVTGPRPAAGALAMDKLATAAVACAHGVPTIATVLWPTSSGRSTDLPERPWVIKPRWGGSSIDVEAGVEDTATIDALARRGVGRAGVLVQPYLQDWIDLSIAVRTHPSVQCSAVERTSRGRCRNLRL